MPGSKGIITDLTSISSLLGTILDQTDQIFSKAENAAGAVGKVTSGGGSGGVGATKRGSGSQSLGLASVPAPTGGSGMAGPAGVVSETKFGGQSASSSTTATAGSNSMGGWLGSMFGGKGAGTIGAIASGVGVAANLAGDVMNMMPDVNTVMNRDASYYHAAITGGNQASISRMQSSAKKNGLYATGMDGNISDYMASMGINFGSSSWNSVARETSNAAQYLNMDPMAAASAYTNLNSGTVSANLMRTMGVSTSDAKGNSLNADQIFSQIDSRIFQPGVNYSVDDVNNNWLKGGMQQMLANMGMDSNQAELYKQHLIAKVSGKPTDMSKGKTLDQLSAAATGAGNENPLSSQYKINESNAKLYDSYQKPYLDGIKAATPLIQAMNKALEAVPDWAKQFKAEMDTLAGNRGTHGAGQLGGDLMSGLLGIGGGLLGGAAAKKLLTKGAGSGEQKLLSKSAGKAVDDAGKFLGDAEKTAAKALPEVGKGATKLLGKAGGAFAAIGVASDLNEGLRAGRNATGAWKKDPWGTAVDTYGKDFQKDPMGTLFSTLMLEKPSQLVGKAAGSAMPDWMWTDNATKGTPLQQPAKIAQNIGNTIADILTGNWDKVSKSMSGKGSSGSTVGTAAAGGGGTISFIMPVNGKITDGFGPRSADSTGGIGSTYHKGLDIAAPMGTPIHAAAAGKVSAVGWDGSFGNRVMIDHSGGYQSIYAHQPSGGPTVTVGQVVKQGDLIGHVGSTGASTGPHCHFEVRLNGTAINPAPLIGAATPVKDTPPATSQPATTATTKPPRLTLLTGTARSQGDIVSSVSQAMPQFASPGSGNASYGSMSTGSAGTPSSLMASNQMAKGVGTGAGGSGGSNQSAMSVPGAKYYKQGDDYVAQDSHVNVHAGEAILNAEAADEWRRSKAGGSKKQAPQVHITVMVQDASDAEARKFANRVKQYLDEDSLDSAMGNR